MLFYSIYGLAGLMTGAYLLYNLNGIYLAFCLAVVLSAIIIFSIVPRLRAYLAGALVFCIFSVLGFSLMISSSTASEFTNEYVTVTGRVSELPYKSGDMWCYVINCDGIDYGGNKRDFKNRITVYSENEYKLDDTVDVSGFLKLHESAKNPGCFNAYTYYKSMGIDYKMTSYDDKISTVTKKSISIYSYAMRFRAKVCEIVDKSFKSDNATVLKIILTGFKKEVDQDYSNVLLSSGVSRSLYSPYFHLILILSFIALLCRKLSARTRRIITIIVCILYLCINPYLLTGRKLFTFTVISELLRMKAGIFRPLDALWVTIILCGLQNPYLLYNEGFLMSCTATVFIIVFYDKIYGRISWINKYKDILRVLVMFFISCFMLMPVAAFLFEESTIYSIFVSVLLLPIICTIYIISPIMLLEADVLGIVGIARIITDNLITFIRNVPALIETLPFSHTILPRPTFTLLLGILFLFAALYKRKFKKVFSVLLCISVGFSLSFLAGEFVRAGKVTVTFLNTAQGDCTVTDIPYKCTIMVDGGGSAEYNEGYDVGARDVFPYLRHNNIRTLDYVFLSHYHKDHADGIVSLMDKVKIKNIFLPDCLQETEYRGIIEEKAREKKIKLHYINGPEKLILEDGVEADILYFDKNAKEENDTSVVMRLSYKDLSCLYTGDITRNIEKKLLAKGSDISADILKVAHHGSDTSSDRDFVLKVSPEFAVAMMSENNTYGFPSRKTKKTFEELKIPLITTAEYGCIQFKERMGRLIWQRRTR